MSLAALGPFRFAFAVGIVLLSAYIIAMYLEEAPQEPRYIKWPWEE